MNEPAPRGDLERVEEILLRDAEGEDTAARRLELSAEARAELDAFLRTEHALLGTASSDSTEGEERLGPYVLLRVLGQGSQGVVYQARDARLGREVALKVLRETAPQEIAHITRFRREAALASRVVHPSICTVFETGENDGRLWIATRLIEGPSLARTLAERSAVPRAPEIPRLLLLSEQIASGLAAAHRGGVVHRDVKPANILLDRDDLPVLVDFGMARELDRAGPTMTRQDVPFGTPAYMAPEQVTGTADADHRADIWSLGATLYEVMTGRRAFVAPTRDSLYHAILSTEPLDAGRVNPALPFDLGIVLATAMEKDRDRRYRTADDLAEDLRRVREHLPILARRPGPVQRMARWCSRNRLATGLILAVTSSLLIALTSLLQTRRSLNEANGLRALSEARVALPRHPTRALQLAIAGARKAPGLIARDTILEVLNEPLPAAIHHDHSRAIRSLLFSPDSSLVTCGADGRVVVRDPAGDAKWQVAEHSPVNSLAISPDGAHIAWSCANRVRIADMQTGEVWFEHTLSATGDQGPADPDEVTALCFGPSGDLLVGSRRGELSRIGISHSGLSRGGSEDEVRWVRQAHDGVVRRIALDPNTARVATAGSDFTAKLWNADGALISTLTHAWNEVDDVSFRPGHDQLATASADNTAWLWELDTARESGRFYGHDSGVNVAQFHPAGAWLLTASWDRTARLWDATSRVPLRTFRGHAASIESGAFSPDGQRIATGDSAGEVRVWNLVDKDAVMVFPTTLGGPAVTAIAPAGDRLVTIDGPESAVVWNLAGARALHRPTDYQDHVVSASISSDGHVMITASADGALFLHDLRTGALLHRMSLGSGGTRQGMVVLAHPTRPLFAAATQRGQGMIASLLTGEVLQSVRAQGGTLASPIHAAMAFTAAGDYLVAVDPDQPSVVRIYDVLTGAEKPPFTEHRDLITSIATHPRSDRVCSTSQDCTARVWSAADRRPALVLDHRNELVTHAAFDARGERLATSTDSGRVRVFDAGSGALLREWAAHDSLIYTLDYSPDGTRLVTASWDQRARVWDPATGTLLLTQGSHRAAVFSARFHPDGAHVLTIGQDGTVRLWPLDPGSVAERRVW